MERSSHSPLRRNILQQRKRLWRAQPSSPRKNAIGRVEIAYASTGTPIVLGSKHGKVFSIPSLSPRHATLLAAFSNGNVERISMMKHRCKMCGFDEMPYPPKPYNICPCCGIEYGVDDQIDSYKQLRNEWLSAGAPWFSTLPEFLRPPLWNAWDQLDKAQLPYDVPRPGSSVVTVKFTVQRPVWIGHMQKDFPRIISKGGMN